MSMEQICEFQYLLKLINRFGFKQMSLLCCSNPKTNQHCCKHTDHLLSLFCCNKNCMQPLCTRCIDEHNIIHSNLSIGAPAIIDIKQVQDFMIDATKKQIGTIEDTKDNKHKPVEVMYKFIDRFFYGSTQRRQNILRNRFRGMVSNYNANLLVSSIQADHEFRLQKGFKEKYFEFLDGLIEQIAKNNQMRQLDPPFYNKKQGNYE